MLEKVLTRIFSADFPYEDEALLLEVRRFSNCKNSSMEFNEFLKMIATIKQKTPTQSDLLEAFR